MCGKCYHAHVNSNAERTYVLLYKIAYLAFSVVKPFYALTSEYLLQPTLLNLTIYTYLRAQNHHGDPRYLWVPSDIDKHLVLRYVRSYPGTQVTQDFQVIPGGLVAQVLLGDQEE